MTINSKFNLNNLKIICIIMVYRYDVIFMINYQSQVNTSSRISRISEAFALEVSRKFWQHASLVLYV